MYDLGCTIYELDYEIPPKVGMTKLWWLFVMMGTQIWRIWKIYELDYEMLRQAQHDKIVDMFGVDRHTDWKDLKGFERILTFQFGLFETLSRWQDCVELLTIRSYIKSIIPTCFQIGIII